MDLKNMVAKEFVYDLDGNALTKDVTESEEQLKFYD